MDPVTPFTNLSLQFPWPQHKLAFVAMVSAPGWQLVLGRRQALLRSQKLAIPADALQINYMLCGLSGFVQEEPRGAFPCLSKRVGYV